MKLGVPVFILKIQSERYIDYTPISECGETSAHSSISLVIKVSVS